MRLGVKGVLGYIVGLLCLLTSCHVPVQDASDWNLTPEQQDSLRFLAQHHYVRNDNFLVTTDSLRLYVDMLSEDQEVVQKQDELVVADYRLVVGIDSLTTVWIQVARDQQTIGWVEESELLRSVVPVNPISRFIYLFGQWRPVVFLIFCLLFLTFYGIRKAHRRTALRTSLREVDYFYPVTVIFMVACTASLYGAIQRFAPELWKHYYFHPSLNPFDWPLSMALFLVGLWMIALLVLAMMEQLKHQTDVTTFFFCLFGTAGICLLCYLFFSVAIYYYIGYPLLLLLACGAWKMIRSARCGYLCGACGRKISQKGKCPYCGAINE
jgi:hypothetical protein